MKSITVGEYKDLMNAGTEDEYQTSKFTHNLETIQCDVFIHDGKATATVTTWDGEGEEACYLSGTFFDDANKAIEIYRTNFRLQTQNWSF